MTHRAAASVERTVAGLGSPELRRVRMKCRHVGFSPKSAHSIRRSECLLWAISGHVPGFSYGVTPYRLNLSAISDCAAMAAAMSALPPPASCFRSLAMPRP